MEQHEYSNAELMGKIKEFMSSMKVFRTNLVAIVIAIVIQVGAFLYLWGSLTTTVKADTKYLWEELAPRTFQNTRDIDKILTKLEYIIDKKLVQ